MSLDQEIARTFNRLFAESHNTVIKGGALEPLYKPPKDNDRGVIRYTHNYTASALHEIAHWCIAGRRRRRLLDYGYWYTPPPRSLLDQRSFFSVESRVQALEWLFADAVGVSFHLSTDDVRSHHAESSDDDGNIARAAFAEQVGRCVDRWRRLGLPNRADRMFRALA